MTLKINTSPGYSTYQLQKNQTDLSNSLNRLSSGRRINLASDDASGMAIADRLKTQASGYSQAIKNASDAVSVIQVADGALGQAAGIVEDIRVKAIQAVNGANSLESLTAIQADIDKSLEALGNIADTTSFNGQKLLSGTFTDKAFQIGSNAGETVQISLGSIDPSSISDETLGSLADIDVTTTEGAQAAIELSDIALDYISAQRSNAGSTQNQLDSTISNLTTSRINTISAESEIRDLDFAEESTNLNRLELLEKARIFAQKQAAKSQSFIIDIFQ